MQRHGRFCYNINCQNNAFSCLGSLTPLLIQIYLSILFQKFLLRNYITLLPGYIFATPTGVGSRMLFRAISFRWDLSGNTQAWYLRSLMKFSSSNSDSPWREDGSEACIYVCVDGFYFVCSPFSSSWKKSNKNVKLNSVTK